MRLTRIAAIAGAVDTGAFLTTRRTLYRRAPGRFGGVVAALGLWVAIAARSGGGRNRRRDVVLLTGANAAGQAAMLGVHLRHRIAGPRVWIGALLSGVALAGAVGGR